jgi:transmembrane sensor
MWLKVLVINSIKKGLGMSFTNDDYYRELIHAFLSNQISEEEVKELQDWIGQSDDNKKQFVECRRVWMLTSQGAQKGKFNKAKYDEWQKLSGKLTPKGEKPSPVILSPLNKLIRIAAIFLLMVSVGTTIAWIINARKLQIFTSMETASQIKAPLGGRSEVTLPDGSIVKLNAGSTISYSRNYGYTERNILLEGEGYFEVETDPRMPFVVEASG